MRLVRRCGRRGRLGLARDCIGCRSIRHRPRRGRRGRDAVECGYYRADRARPGDGLRTLAMRAACGRAAARVGAALDRPLQLGRGRSLRLPSIGLGGTATRLLRRRHRGFRRFAVAPSATGRRQPSRFCRLLFAGRRAKHDQPRARRARRVRERAARGACRRRAGGGAGRRARAVSAHLLRAATGARAHAADRLRAAPRARFADR